MVIQQLDLDSMVYYYNEGLKIISLSYFNLTNI